MLVLDQVTIWRSDALAQHDTMPCAGQYTYRLGNLLSAVAFHVLAVSAICDAVYLLKYANISRLKRELL